jgi:outer membrane protein assembly factor BamB
MISKYFPIFPVVFSLLVPGSGFAASDGSPNCRIEPELIFQMVKPEYGAYNVWDVVHGEMDRDEDFVSGVVLESGNVVVATEEISFGKPDRILKIIEFDQRGRMVWEVTPNVAGLSGIKKILATPRGFMVAGVMQKKSAWLGFFDDAGKLTGQKTISAGGNMALMPEDVISGLDGKGFVLSASVGSGANRLYYGAIYHIDFNGRVTGRHAYMPGLDNRILGLSPAGKDAYMASGFLRGEDGRLTGWLLKLNPDGSLIWQRQYPRGASAQINKAVSFTGGSVLAVGQTEPLNDGNIAAWIMMIDDATGNVVWQRYYTGSMDQAAKDVLANAGGLASVMVQNTKPEGMEPTEDRQDFARVLTVNARGLLTVSDEYFNGEGAQIAQMIGGRAGERILLGRTDIVYKIEPKPGEEVETLKHGWDGLLIAGAPMESFDDPCLRVNPFGE